MTVLVNATLRSAGPGAKPDGLGRRDQADRHMAKARAEGITRALGRVTFDLALTIFVSFCAGWG
jgi:hypothetical protein